MKKSLIVLFSLVSVITYSQEVVTTDIEYNYATRGYYRQVVEEGGDVKKGYEVRNLGGNNEMSDYSFQFSAMVKLDDNTLVGTLVIAKSKATSSWVTSKTHVFFIPVNNPSLAQLYMQSLNEMNQYFWKDYCKVTSIMMQQLMTEEYKTATKK